MTNKSTKRALLTSFMALFLCFAMLLGTTYAWFTDSVTSAGNKIVAGTLDVQLLMDADVDGTYDDISDSTSPIFGKSSIAQNNNAETLWEPGKTQVAYLAIKNNGNLDLKYTVGLDVQNVSKDLYEVMEYAIVPDADANHKVTSWTSGNSVEVGTQSVSGDVSLPVGATHYFALVIHMDEEAGNEYQGGEVNFDLTVLATQDTVESDSFNNQYDKDAVYGDVMVSSDAELKAAIEDPAMKVIAVNGDLTYDWGSESYENSKALNMKGKIFLGANDAASITFAGYGSANPIVDATFRNITIKDSTVGDNEASWEHGYLEFKNLTAVNVTFANSIMMEGDFATFKNCSFNSSKNGEYAVWVANGDATFEGCTFTGPRGVKVHEAYGSEVGTVVIDNNTFAGLTQKPGVAIGTVNAATTIKITNNVFAATQPGDQNNYKYETDTDVDTINFTENNNIVIGGKEIVDGVYENGTRNYYVYTAEGLQNVFADVIPQNREQSQTVNLMADIDLTGIIWQPIGNMHFTFNGNGHTISNVTCAEGCRSGFFGYAGGVKVNDLTLENVTSAGAQAGTFAGSAEGLTTTNCFLKGTNTVTYVPYENETWGGVGAVTGVVASSNINVTLVEGATVTLNKSGLTTNCPYIDNLTGYLDANGGTVVNNGTVQVIDLAIATAEELFAFAKDVNENGNSYLGKTVALVADIDLNNQAWTPIGQTGSTEFKGTFDGQGHTIKNLNVDSSAQTGKHYSSGLFGWVEGRVTIKNVNIDGATVKGNHNVGALLGYTYSAQISNCHVANATIVCIHMNNDACGDKAGGIVGYAGNESRFTDCAVSDSTVTAGRDAGQMIGCGYNVSVSNCSATNVLVTAGGDCTGANINESVIGRVM